MSFLNEKKANKFILLCWLVYTVSYLGRLNYSASMVHIIDDLLASRSAAGLVASCFYFCYAAGQFVNGLLVSRYNKKYFIFGGLILSAVCNTLMPLAPNIQVMQVVWFFNGLSQSVLWCTIIKSISIYVPTKMIERAVFLMGTTVPVGTALNYAICSLFSGLLSWRVSFFIEAVLMAIVAFIWLTSFSGITKTDTAVATEVEITDDRSAPNHRYIFGKLGSMLLLGIGIILSIAICNNFIKDGLTTWVPNILHEVYSLPKSVSIILAVILPLLATLGNILRLVIQRWVHDMISICLIFYSTSILALLLLTLLYRQGGPVISLILFAVTACVMAGVNNVTTSLFPLRYRDKIDSGFMSGIINGFCYVGSTLSSYTVGAVADNKGWSGVFLLFLILSGVATALCIIYTLFHRNHDKHEAAHRQRLASKQK